MKKRWPIVVLVIILILAVIAGAVYYFTGEKIFNQFTKIQTREQTIENRKEYIDNFNEFARGYEVEDISLESQLGDHKIPGIVIRKPENEKYAVLAHGMGGTKESIYPAMKVLIEEGYNCISLDMRQSGENEAEYNTGGVLESYDVIDGILYARTLTEKPVLVYGESFGGATVLQAFSKNPNIFGLVILDCPVSDGRFYLEEIAKEENIPIDFFLSAGDRVYKSKLGFTLDEMDALEKLKITINKDMHVPFLILNSKIDMVTPYYMGKNIYDAIPYEEKMIYSSEIAQHAKLHQLEPEGYKYAIHHFLETYGNN